MTPLELKQPPGVKSIECRFAVHCKSGRDDPKHDLHFIKEVHTHEDGTQTPHVRLKYDFKRDFYVSKKGQRTHKEFKEWEKLENLDRYECTQSELTEAVAKALGQAWYRGSLRDLCAQPYVFGVDINSTSLIKHQYHEKWPVSTPYTLAVFDTETDVIHGHGQIMMATISCKQRIFVAVQQDFVAGHANALERIYKLTDKYIGDVLAKRQAKVEIKIVPSEIDVVKEVFARAHEWKPDWLAVWNIVFDVEKVIAACERAHVDINDVLCDPAVPKEFRFFKYKKGNAKKVMASGRILNFKPSQQWHTVIAPSSFYWMDAMCAYRQVRMGSPEEQSYALDYILKKNEIGGKLTFKEAEHLEDNKLDWHKFMQSRHPLEYVVYNIYDCVGIELLDEKTRDLQLALPNFAGFTDFNNFNSLPRKTMNDLHFFVQKFNRVPGSTASEMTTEMDADTVDVKGWISMLPSHQIADNGLRIIEENPSLASNIRVATADLDIEGAYPTNENVCNVSKETTAKELVKVEGVPEQLVRMSTINFSGGRTNAVEFCTAMYGMPALDKLLEEFKKDLAT